MIEPVPNMRSSSWGIAGLKWKPLAPRRGCWLREERHSVSGSASFNIPLCTRAISGFPGTNKPLGSSIGAWVHSESRHPGTSAMKNWVDHNKSMDYRHRSNAHVRLVEQGSSPFISRKDRNLYGAFLQQWQTQELFGDDGRHSSVLFTNW